jgi:hypothetical protein
VGMCLQYGDIVGGSKFQLFFDQKEQYYGHIYDRWKNPRVRRAEPVWERVIHVGEANMRTIPGLQTADLLAWSVNHAEQDRLVRYSWQERILNIDREKEILDYEALRKPLAESINCIKGYKLPQRRRFT